MKRIIQEKFVPDVVFYPTKVHKEVSKEVDGRIIVVTELDEIDPSTVNEGLKASDFALDVLIAHNSVDLLQPSSVIKESNMRVADTINNFE